MTTPPVLFYLDYEELLIVTTDGSETAIGFILEPREEDGRVNPLAYACRVMASAERNYTTTEKEDVAVVFALK